MNKLFALPVAALAALLLCDSVSAQNVTGPVITAYHPMTQQAQTVVGSPVTTYYAPQTTGVVPATAYSQVVSQPTTTYYAPQAVTVARPMVQPATTYAPAPVVSYRPITSASIGAPVVTYRPAAPVYAAQAPVVAYRPVAQAVAAPAPYISYRPAANYTYASPVATSYGYAPVVAARPVIVSPKVYYPGQPVRNVLRAITP